MLQIKQRERNKQKVVTAPKAGHIYRKNNLLTDKTMGVKQRASQLGFVN